MRIFKISIREKLSMHIKLIKVKEKENHDILTYFFLWYITQKLLVWSDSMANFTTTKSSDTVPWKCCYYGLFFWSPLWSSKRVGIAALHGEKNTTPLTLNWEVFCLSSCHVENWGSSPNYKSWPWRLLLTVKSRLPIMSFILFRPEQGHCTGPPEIKGRGG